MTALTRPVRRTLQTPWRELVLILHPPTPDMGASIELRPKRARRGPRIEVAKLYVRLVDLEASAAKSQRAKRRAK